jgi:hypothetical protein
MSAITRLIRKEMAFGAAERMRSHITRQSTRLLDSFPFIVLFPDLVECFMLAAGYLCVRFLLHGEA